MRSLQGHFLVASPHLPDPNFFRTVVLVVQHDKDGALGLVLNRPTNSTVRELWEKVAEGPCLCDRPVNHGGPVDGPLMALHADMSCADNEVLSGVYVSSRDTHLRRLVLQNEPRFRLFVGYAGWAAGQLEGELKAGGWLVTEATAEDIFDDDEDLWRRIASRIGFEILDATLRPRHVPKDPRMN